jgi:nucleotide-binding universal stress UspA family protein
VYGLKQLALRFLIRARKQDMSSSKKILVAVDGSSQSLSGVNYVVQSLSPKDLEVNLIYVMPTVPEPFWDLEKIGFFKKMAEKKREEYLRKAEEAARVFLDEARNLLSTGGIADDDVRLILHPRQVGIARDIIAESSRGYDAVVVGRRGLSKFEDIYLGSVSYKIVQGLGDTPVWVVGEGIKSRKMLLAVDGSDNSRKALDYAATFAAANGAEVTLFNAVREFSLELLDIATPSGAEIEASMLGELERDVQLMLEAYKRRLEEAGVEASRISKKYTLQSRSRAEDILQEAKQGECGTIIMGRRGLSSVHDFPLGRVTTKVLHRADLFALWIVP